MFIKAENLTVSRKSRDLTSFSPCKQSLCGNAIANYVGLGTRTLLFLLLTPYFVHKLGNTSYGLWLLALSLVGYAGLLEVGVSYAIERYVAKFAGAGDIHGMNRVLGTGMLFFSFVGGVLAIIFIAYANEIAAWFRLDVANRTNFSMALRIFGLTCAVAFPSKVLRQALVAREAFVYVNALFIVSQMAQAILSVVLLETGFGIQGMALAMFITTLFDGVAHLYLCKKRYPLMCFRSGTFNKIELRSLLGYGSFSLLWAIGDQLRFRLPPLVIGKVVSVDAIAIFSIGAMILNQGSLILMRGAQVMKPRLSYLDGKGDDSSLQNVFVHSSQVFALMSSFIFGVSLMFGSTFIKWWVGKDFSSSYDIVMIMSWGYCILRTQVVSIELLFAKGRHGKIGVVCLCEGLLNLVLSVFMARRWGFHGVAAAGAMTMGGVAFFYLPIAAYKSAGLSLSEYYCKILIRPLSILCAAYVIAFTCMQDGAPTIVIISAGSILWLFLITIVFRSTVKDLLIPLIERFYRTARNTWPRSSIFLWRDK